MAKKRSKSEWAKIVEDYKLSGMSMRAYSEENDINAKTLSNYTRSNTSNTKNQRCDGIIIGV